MLSKKFLKKNPGGRCGKGIRFSVGQDDAPALADGTRKIEALKTGLAPL